MADQGTHRFSYALMPHDGLAASLQRAGSVTEQAEAFNLHLRAVPVNDAVGEQSATLVSPNADTALGVAAQAGQAVPDRLVRGQEPVDVHPGTLRLA